MGIENGVIISATQPAVASLATYVWCKPTPTTVEWYEVHNGEPTLVATEPLAWLNAIAEHSALPDVHHSKTHASDHSEGGSDPVTALGDIHFIGKVFAGAGDTNQGETRVITIPNVCILTFKKGIMTKYEVIVPP